MFQIGICDDDRSFIEKFSQLVTEIFCSIDLEINITPYLNGNDLVGSEKEFDILFLDIEMPKFSGFETAAALSERLSKNDTLLIFCTNHDDAVFDTYSFHPFWFLRKEFIDKKLKQILTSAAAVLKNRLNVFKFIYEGQPNVLKMADILYFEINEKTIGIYTNSKTYYFKNTFSFVEKQINKDFFVRCHRNYIVNCAYIDKISKNGILLTNKKNLPVSQRRIKELKEKFHNFVFLGE